MRNKEIIIFMPSIEDGGVEKNLFIISNFLSLKFKNTKIITYDKKYNSKFKNLKVLNPKPYFKFLSRKSKYLFCLITLAKKLLKNQNYIVFAFQANLYCALLCIFFPKVKLITRSNSSPTGWSKNFLKKKIFYLLFKRIDKVIVNSKEFKNEINKKFKIKSEFIYNPLNKKEIIEKSKEKKNINFFNDKSLKIINIGRLVHQKDQLTFLRSLENLKNKINFKALIIGNGILKEELTEFIHKNKLDKNVKILNFKKNPYNYLNKCDLLVHTAKYEGLPNILLEAQVLKKYIISTQCPTGPNEILMGGKAGALVKIEDYKQITKEILFFNQNKKRLQKKIIIGFNNLKRFDFKCNLKKYLKIINSLL